MYNEGNPAGNQVPAGSEDRAGRQMKGWVNKWHMIDGPVHMRNRKV